jgi:hypothetical protein
MRKSPRSVFIPVLVIALAVAIAPLRADVKTQERSLVKFTGMLGKMVGLFGGKGAREGVVSSIALKGDRKARTTDKSEQIIDLAEEKIYDLDLEDKSYTVTTFAELRKKMEDARQRAKEQADKRAGKEEKEAKDDKKGPEYEVDFDLKNTGEKKTISGFDTHQVIMTITVREKGKTLEEAGGVVLTADTWLAPTVPEMKELAAFERRYVQALYGPVMSTQEMQQFAMAMAAHPALKDAMGRFQKEKGSLDGTPISTVLSIDGVQSRQEQAEQSARKDKDDSDSDSGPSSPSGMLGGFAKKFAKKKADEGKDKDTEQAPAQKGHATFMTITNDVLKIEPSATTADVSIPAGFKQK